MIDLEGRFCEMKLKVAIKIYLENKDNYEEFKNKISVVIGDEDNIEDLYNELKEMYG